MVKRIQPSDIKDRLPKIVGSRRYVKHGKVKVVKTDRDPQVTTK